MPNEKNISANLPALERMVPERDKGAAFFYEHILRYLFSCEFTKGKVVLDAGCGSGYGSFIIGSNGKARIVKGIDRSEDAIKNAKQKYKSANVDYLQDDVEKLESIADKSVNVVVSFEVLEHLSDQNNFVKTIKRVLKNEGLFIVSTPNKQNYPPGNQFHTKELSLTEFKFLLKKYFKNIKILHQGLEFSQNIRARDNKDEFNLIEKFSKEKTENYYPLDSNDNSQYLIAVCSDSNIPNISPLALSAFSLDGFDIKQGIATLHKRFSKLQVENNRLSETLNMTEKNLLNTTQKLASAESELNYIKYSDYFRLWPIYENFKKIIINFRKIYLLKQKFVNEKHAFRRYLKDNYPDKAAIKSQISESKKFKLKPKISIIIPTYNTPEKFLRECIESVLNQSYGNFEICIADDSSADRSVRRIIKEYSEKDIRIKYIFRKENGHISKASNSALDLATGDYIGLLDHDDILWPNALFEIVKALNQNHSAQFLYTDEDKLEEDGITHNDPFFKPDWSPDYLRSINYITHFCVIKTSLVRKVNGFRVGYEGAQDWDLFLRITNLLKSDSIFHVPKILYSWRKSVSSTASEKNGLSVKSYAYANQKKALENDLESKKISGWVETTDGLGSWRVRYNIKGNPKISIIIPTKDKHEYISVCLNSILKKTTYSNFELIIIDTGSKDENIWNFYDQIKEKHKQTKIIKWDKEFNFSSVCNFGASHAKGEYLIFLNNDTEILTRDWIEGLLEHGQRPEIGAVGCMLLYPDQSIQHLGGILGISGSTEPAVIGVAGHAYRGKMLKDFNHFDKGAIKNYSFVTAACLLISKKKFNQIGQFDPKFKIAFNDVDFGLRTYFNYGLFNVVNPFVSLTHSESISVARPGEKGRNIGQMQKEIALFVKRWGKVKDKDPFYNLNLTRMKEDFSIGKNHD